MIVVFAATSVGQTQKKSLWSEEELGLFRPLDEEQLIFRVSGPQ